MWTEIPKKVNFFHWFQKEVQMCVILWENDPSSQLIYDLSEQFPDEIMVSINRTRRRLSVSPVLLEVSSG